MIEKIGDVSFFSTSLPRSTRSSSTDLSDKLAPETQVGFRPEHGSGYGLLVVRRILECFRSMKGEDLGVFLLFVDLKKAFDSVVRDILWFSWKRNAVFRAMW